MSKLSSIFENSVTEVGEAETSKFRPIAQFGDCSLTNLREFIGSLLPKPSGHHARDRVMHAPADFPFVSLPHLPAYKRTICWKLSTGLNNVVLYPVNKVVNKVVQPL